jgi:hypothetical protein
MDDERCAGCGGRLSRRASVCLKCGHRRPSATTEAELDPVDWAEPATRPDRPVEARPSWADPATGPSREHGTPPPSGATERSGLRTTVRGRVTSLAEVRQEKVRRPFLVIAAFSLALLLQLVVFAVGLAFRIMFAILARRPGSLFGGGGRMGSMFTSTVTGLSGEAMPVQPFRVTADDGSVTECVLRGSIRGGSVELDDAVEVTGSWVRGGGSTLQVTRVRNLTTGAETTARLPAGMPSGSGGLVLPAVAGFVVLLFLLSWLLR